MENTEILKNEAVKRLRILEDKGLHIPVINDFSDDGRIYYSDRIPGDYGILYWFEKNNGVPAEWLEKVSEFEERYGYKVYHITHEVTCFGECLDLFYVSNDENYWLDDRFDLMNDRTFAYVINLDEPYFSEFGTIGFKVSGGGLIRTA